MYFDFQVNASSAISLLQSDIKMALKSAFGTLDGPLSVTDWCKGRSQSGDVGTVGDGFSGESSASASECRDSSSTLSVGEPISPSQSSVGGSSSVKGTITFFVFCQKVEMRLWVRLIKENWKIIENTVSVYDKLEQERSYSVRCSIFSLEFFFLPIAQIILLHGK